MHPDLHLLVDLAVLLWWPWCFAQGFLHPDLHLLVDLAVLLWLPWCYAQGFLHLDLHLLADLDQMLHKKVTTDEAIVQLWRAAGLPHSSPSQPGSTPAAGAPGGEGGEAAAPAPPATVRGKPPAAGSPSSGFAALPFGFWLPLDGRLLAPAGADKPKEVLKAEAPRRDFSLQETLQHPYGRRQLAVLGPTLQKHREFMCCNVSGWTSWCAAM